MSEDDTIRILANASTHVSYSIPRPDDVHRTVVDDDEFGSPLSAPYFSRSDYGDGVPILDSVLLAPDGIDDVDDCPDADPMTEAYVPRSVPPEATSDDAVWGAEALLPEGHRGHTPKAWLDALQKLVQDYKNKPFREYISLLLQRMQRARGVVRAVERQKIAEYPGTLPTLTGGYRFLRRGEGE
jgi:hypothetical protein